MKEDNYLPLDTNQLKKDLEFSKEDAVVTVTKATLSLIPYLGGPAVELFDAVTTPMLSKRRDMWIVMFANTINELANRIDESSLEKLSENEMFITTVMHASQIAIRNHQEEKLAALKNAVLNSALKNAPEEDLQLMFLDLVDSFTTLHLKLLNFFNEPESTEFLSELNENHAAVYSGSIPKGQNLYQKLEVIFPELKGKSYIYEIVISDLESKKMFSIDDYEVSRGIFNSKVLPLGKMFLSFITNPE